MNQPPWHSQPIASLPWAIRMFPMRVFQLYLGCTVVLFALGPWPWPVKNPISLLAYLAANQIALWWGYRSVIRRQPREYNGLVRVDRLVLMGLLAWIIFFVQLHKTRSGFESVEVGDFIRATVNGAEDPGSAYREGQTVFFENAASNSRLSTVVSFGTWLASPLLWAVLPVGVCCWRQLRATLRIGVITYIILETASWIASGRNKGVVDIFIIIPWMMLASHPNWLLARNRIKFTGLVASATVAAALVFLSFTAGQVGRRGGAIPTHDSATNISLDLENWTTSLLPLDGAVAIGAASSYVTQGYYGLSLAMEEPFRWCYGFGNSYYLHSVSNGIFNDDYISERTYSARISSEWDMFGRWSSIYAWFANDVSFWGVPIVMFLVGRLFGLTWLDVLAQRNPFAAALFALLLIMLCYIPANNQVLHFSATLFPFGTFLALWMYSRRASSTFNNHASPSHADWRQPVD